MAKYIMTREEFMSILLLNMPGTSSFNYINPVFLIDDHHGPREIVELPTHIEFDIDVEVSM